MELLKESLIGKKFGDFMITGFSGRDHLTHIFWNYTCSCSYTGIIRRDQLSIPSRTTCNHDNKKLLDKYLNKEFKHLIIISLLKKDNNVFWNCKCVCGTVVVVKHKNILRKRTNSCGCKTQEDSLKTRRTKISFEKSVLYKTLYKRFYHIKERCYNINNSRYKDYGGRGIMVCDEWKENPKAFIDWAVKNGYEENLTIDRIDVNGNYEPGNCRWATAKEQARNRRSNVYLKINNEILTMVESTEKYGAEGVSPRLVGERIKRGYTPEKAVLTPNKRFNNKNGRS